MNLKNKSLKGLASEYLEDQTIILTHKKMITLIEYNCIFLEYASCLYINKAMKESK